MTQDRESQRTLGEIQEEQRSSTPALTTCAIASTPATDNEILAHLAALSLFCQHPGMTPEQAKLKARMCCADLRGVSEPVLAAACKRYRNSPVSEHRFFHLGTLQAFVRDEARAARHAALPAIPAIAGPLMQEIPPHPCPVPRLSGATENDPRPLIEALQSIAETRAAVPADDVVYLDKVRDLYPPRKIAVTKESA